MMASDLTTATVRTVTPTMWAALLVWLADRAGVSIPETWALAVVPVVLGIVYRLGREIEARWPAVGRVLFGSGRTPIYED